MPKAAVGFLAIVLMWCDATIGTAHAQCLTPLGLSCSAYASSLEAGSCIKPRQVYLLEKKWTQITRKRVIFTNDTTLKFFYVIDARNVAERYRALFVGYELVLAHSTASKVHLYKNLESVGTEGKDQYSRAVKHEAFPRDSMKNWTRIPEVRNVLTFKTAELKNFDFPQSGIDATRAPHANLYRYQTSSISCIPFEINVTAEVNSIIGKVVDIFTENQPTDFFQVSFHDQ